ncbi:FecR family protein [Hydrogenophaga sp. BPS33]|uniref:FecR family protein n=1 Tax=Hydrogenophaga sp. BPS33 TaxID=2651974 RepID=UPI0013204B44|nr:FecR domain-containing protein [Hydrogenophaga sp. BPS33]QHE83637.1 DUF4880 domain-containing protein [Hydrogenophaga sp. BPS33]
MTVANVFSNSSTDGDDPLRLREAALGWFVRRRDTAAWGRDDEAAFQSWLASDVRHAPAYAQCGQQWERLDGMPDDLMARMRRNLVRDKALMETLQAPAEDARPMAVASRRRFLQPATALAGVALMAGVGLLTWRHQQAKPVWVQAFQTGRGEQRSVRLPDGSTLRLDTATRVAVSYYRGQREVRLFDGQALFDVQADAARPFHLWAGPLRVTVVGTRFSVRHTPDLPGNAGVRVAVEHGKVRVARPDAFGEGNTPRWPGVLLTAGEQVASDARGVLEPVAAVPSGGIAPWQNQRVSFVDVPLGQALAELERYRPSGLRVRDPAVAALRLSGTFDPLNPQTLRIALPRVLPVRLSDSGDGETEVLLR